MSDRRRIASDVAAAPLSELFSLQGKRAVVTGGARGIGRSIVERLAEAGAHVCIGDIDLEAAEATAKEVSDRFGVKSEGLALDVRDRATVDNCVAAAVATLSGLDIWVNNAAIYPGHPLLDVPDEEWAAVLEIDLTGTFYCCRAAAKAMLEDEDRTGKVVLNMSSLSGLRGRKSVGAYVAAKHGVTGLTKSLALELGSEGIRVMALAPSIVDTPGMRARRESLEGDQLKAVEELERNLIDSIPLGRQGVPDDIARVALFCVSDMSAWMTGTIIPVDGGMAAS
jgi:NAD(P)-dependent dehydrogenase (short-subunit alcohol dehydrogenase family)